MVCAERRLDFRRYRRLNPPIVCVSTSIATFPLQLAVPDLAGVKDVWRLHWEAELVKLNEDIEVG